MEPPLTDPNSSKVLSLFEGLVYCFVSTESNKGRVKQESEEGLGDEERGLIVWGLGCVLRIWLLFLLVLILLLLLLLP